MKTKLLIMLLATALYIPAFAQKDKNKQDLSEDDKKELLKKMVMDSFKIIKNAAEKACKCIDSISLTNKSSTELAQYMSDCIANQALVYQGMVKINNSFKDPSAKVVVNSDENSDEFKKYYYELERFLKDSCAALNLVLALNNKESKYSMSKDPEAIAEYTEGIKLVEKEEYKEALKHFKKAVKIDDNFAFAWDNIGVCCRRLGQLDEAIDAYNKSLSLDPKGVTPLQNIPIVYEYKKEYDKAIDGYKNFIKIFPDDPEGYFGLGRLYAYVKNDLENSLDNMCKAYNMYAQTNSPYRVDAEKVISALYAEFKKAGKEDVFDRILKENHITLK